MKRKYIYGPGMDNPVAMIRRIITTDYWYYYYTDVLGSVRLLTNASGAVVESYTYDPYGRPRVMYAAGTDGNWLTEDVVTYTSSLITRGNPIMFTGRWWDSAAKLYYYRFRDYSPTLGRFLQPDPAKYIDGMNLYAYCGNNPINWIDPCGLAYYDINFSIGTRWGVGVTFGWMQNSNGMYPYFGVGLVSPGFSIATMGSPSNPTPGYNWGIQGTGFWGGVAGQIGGNFEDGSASWEAGLGHPLSGSLTGYHVWGPLGGEPPTPIPQTAETPSDSTSQIPKKTGE